MTPQHEEALRYLRLANRDAIAFRILALSPESGFALAGFHAQQAVEKAMKAVMCIRGILFRRTHDLEELAAQLMEAGGSVPLEAGELRRLTPYAVEFRYDDDGMSDLISPKESMLWVDQLLVWAEGCVATESQR